MVKNISINKLNLSFVIRHKWDEDSKSQSFNHMFSTYNCGIWFRKTRKVGAKNFKLPKEWGSNIVNHYMVGLDLFVIKLWFTCDWGGHKPIKLDL
jgi:hypothetical protein